MQFLKLQSFIVTTNIFFSYNTTTTQPPYPQPYKKNKKKYKDRNYNNKNCEILQFYNTKNSNKQREREGKFNNRNYKILHFRNYKNTNKYFQIYQNIIVLELQNITNIYPSLFGEKTQLTETKFFPS